MGAAAHWAEVMRLFRPRQIERPKPSLPYRAAIIRWHDAHEDSAGGWVDPADVDTLPYVVVSCAFVVELGESEVVVAQDVSPDGMLCGVSHIPRGMVVSVSFLS